MSAHEYKPGDKVIIWLRNVPQRTATVKAVKQYKRGAKVTLTDDTEWEGNSSGHAWGTRSERFYAGPCMHLWTEAGAAELAMRIRCSAVEFVAANWAKLTDEQRVQIGDLARAIRKATQG